MTGEGDANAFAGGAGNERFVATVNDGNDSYAGGADSDTYDLSLTSAGATVTATASVSAETGSDSLASIENVVGSQGNDTITLNGGGNVIDGQGGNDVIESGGGNDTVVGGVDNDTLTGGTGLDTLTGGLGNDTFDFNAFNESNVGIGNNDLIADFEGAGIAVGDIIDLSTLDANATIAGNQVFQFIGTSAFSDPTPGGNLAAGQVRYVQLGGDTFVQVNANNNLGNVEFELRLVGLHNLTQQDFIL